MDAIGKRLTKFRKNKNLTQKEVATLLSVPTTTYRDWEYGRLIQGEPYLKLDEIFGVSLSDILGVDSLQIRRDLINKLRSLKQQVEDIEKNIHSLF